MIHSDHKALLIKRLEKAWPLIPALIHPEFLTLSASERWKFWKAIIVYVICFCAAVLFHPPYFPLFFVLLLISFFAWIGVWHRYMHKRHR